MAKWSLEGQRDPWPKEKRYFEANLFITICAVRTMTAFAVASLHCLVAFVLLFEVECAPYARR